MAGGARASRFLRATGQHAVIEPDTYTDGGFVLSIGGAEQSHVDLADPEDIFYEYLRRIGHVVDLAAPWGEPHPRASPGGRRPDPGAVHPGDTPRLRAVRRGA
jgi:hypothetical protein